MVDPEERRAYWNARYAEKGYVFGTEANVFVARHLADVDPGRALDLACGQGRNAIWLARRGHQVTGIDHSQIAIEQARRLAEQAGVEVEFVVGDVVADEADHDAYDLVLLSYLQLEEERRVPAHANAVRAVAPGGMVLLVAHHLDNLDRGYGGPDRPEVLYTPAVLAADFASLTIQRNEAVERTVDTPDGPRGAIDIVLVARKNAGD